MLKTKEISYVIDLLEDHDGKLRSVDDLVDQTLPPLSSMLTGMGIKGH